MGIGTIIGWLVVGAIAGWIAEKILGTVHIALGRAYPECGGVNRSALHWDIVKDLRAEGGAVGSIRMDDTWLIRAGEVQAPLAAATVGSRLS